MLINHEDKDVNDIIGDLIFAFKEDVDSVMGRKPAVIPPNN